MSPAAKTLASKANLKKKSPTKSDIRAAAVHTDYPASTNVSSPVQAKSRRRVQQLQRNDQQGYDSDNGFIVADDEMDETSEESEDGFEPLREAGKPRAEAKRRLGPPITTDEKMKGLNAIHQAVVEDFMHNAKEVSKNVSLHPRFSKVRLLKLTMADSHPPWAPCQSIHRHIAQRDGYQFPYQ